MKKRVLGGTLNDVLKVAFFGGVPLFTLVSNKYPLDTVGYLMTGAFFLYSLFLLVRVWKIIKTNRENYDHLFELFPELKGQLANLEKGASFIDHQFGLLIYKDYLIAYRTGAFAFVPLDQVTNLHYAHRINWITRLPQRFLIADCLEDLESVYLPIRAFTLNNPKIWLEEIHKEVIKDFPHITYN